MIDIIDTLMYTQYFWKVVYLKYLKTVKKLDYIGRIENIDPFLRGYEGCYPVKRLLKRLPIMESDTIIDIGCGKGLFLYYASMFDFHRIDGLEYSAELAKTALQNVKVIRDRRIHIFHCDARQFTKYEWYNYFFINNPFSAEIMDEVILKILESYSIRKRKIVIIYQFPFNQEIFIKYGFKVLYEKFPNTILIFD